MPPNTCRTCSEFTEDNYNKVTKICYSEILFKDIIISLVPELEETLSEDDCICNRCTNVLVSCVKFIEKCYEVENEMRQITQDKDVQVLSEVADILTECPPEETYCSTLCPSTGVFLTQTSKSSLPQSEVNMTPSTNPATQTGRRSSSLLETDTIKGSTLPFPAEAEDTFTIDGGDYPVSDTSDSAFMNESSQHPEASFKRVKSPDEAIPNSAHTNELQQTELIFAASEPSDISEIPDSMLINDTAVALKQPKGIVIKEFIVKLATYGVNIIQASEEADINKPGPKKRILLLGTCCPREKKKCPNCPRSFNNQDRLRYHLKTKKCFSTKNSLDTEGQGNTGGYGIKVMRWRATCPNCGDIFPSRKEMLKHLKTHPQFVCDRCGKRYSDNNAFSVHQLDHKETYSYVCEVCGNAFKTGISLKNHMHHHEDGEWQCEKCPKLFKSASFLKRHMKYHSGTNKRASCTECSKTFFSKGDANQHYRLIHLGLKPYQCMSCLRVFGRSDYLRKHKCHNGPVDLASQTSGKPARTRNSRRIIKHVTPSKVPCKICGKYYSGMVNLKLHLETHLKLKRFPCKLCRLSFSNAANLNRHSKQHTSYENKLRCNVCWKKMDTKEDLENHMSGHNNPRYRCDKCNKPFHRKYLLANHKIAEHVKPEDVRLGEEIIHRNLLEVEPLSSE